MKFVDKVLIALGVVTIVAFILYPKFKLQKNVHVSGSFTKKTYYSVPTGFELDVNKGLRTLLDGTIQSIDATKNYEFCSNVDVIVPVDEIDNIQPPCNDESHEHKLIIFERKNVDTTIVRR